MAVLFFSVFPSDLCFTIAWRRSGRTNAAKIECVHMRARKLLTCDYNQNFIIFHSTNNSLAFLKAFNTNTLIINNIAKINYLLIKHHICTTPDTAQLEIFIHHFLIILKLKNVRCSK